MHNGGEKLSGGALDKRISIIIPLFNKGKFISEAINSILSQTHPYWEVIVVDDGSTDNGPEIVKSFKDSRIRLILGGENKGVSATRNRGIKEAKYEWIAFLDADDMWKKDFLETIVWLMEKHPECVVYATSYECFNNETGTTTSLPVHKFPKGWVGIVEDYFSANAQSQIFNTTSIVVKRNALFDVGLFPEGISHGEDIFVWVNLSLRFRIAFINSSKAVYRLGVENQATSKKSDYKVLYYLLDLQKNGKISEKFADGYRKYMARVLYNAVRSSLLQGQNKEMAIGFLKVMQEQHFDIGIKKYWYSLWVYAPRIFGLLVKIKTRVATHLSSKTSV